MTEEQVEAIRTAVDIIRMGGTIKRVDGESFTAYKVGQLVRVDIKQDAQLDGKVAR